MERLVPGADSGNEEQSARFHVLLSTKSTHDCLKALVKSYDEAKSPE